MATGFLFCLIFVLKVIFFLKSYKFFLRKCALNENESKGKQVIWQIGKVLTSYFPDLYDKLSGIVDPRKRREYALTELVMGGIMLFVFKEGSRNAFDNERKEAVFSRNYQRAFHLQLPGMDAVEDLYRLLDAGELEKLKTFLIKELVEKKVFHRFRFLGKRYLIAIDGTGVASYASNYCGECTSKTSSKTGKTTYYHHVLEAKLVTSNGISASLLTEWIRNENGKEYDKQDCELTAFKRLAVRLKQLYPRLPIVILADGLYANAPFFQICRENGWDFIVSFKDGNLPSVHQEIALLPGSAKQTRKRFIPGKEGFIREQSFEWINGIDYCGFTLSVITCHEIKTWIKSKKTEEKNFTHISSIPIDQDNYYHVSDSGRMRWNIENSFDYLKEHGYNLGHKFSRVSFQALKNYHQSMMLGHLINQFVEKSVEIVALLARDSKLTIIHLWKKLTSYLSEQEMNTQEYDQFVRKRNQIRLA